MLTNKRVAAYGFSIVILLGWSGLVFWLSGSNTALGVSVLLPSVAFSAAAGGFILWRTSRKYRADTTQPKIPRSELDIRWRKRRSLLLSLSTGMLLLGLAFLERWTTGSEPVFKLMFVVALVQLASTFVVQGGLLAWHVRKRHLRQDKHE